MNIKYCINSFLLRCQVIKKKKFLKILVCNIFVATTNLVNSLVKSKFLIEMQSDPEHVSEAFNLLEREVLKEFHNLKPHWVLLIFLVAKSFLDWSFTIKSALFEKRIAIDSSNSKNFLVNIVSFI